MFLYLDYQKDIKQELAENEIDIHEFQMEEATLRKELEKAQIFIVNHLPPGVISDDIVSLSGKEEDDVAVAIASRLWQALSSNDYDLFLSIFSNEANNTFLNTLDYSSSIEEREKALYDLMKEYTRNGQLVQINARETDYLEAELHFEYADHTTKKVKIDLSRMDSAQVDDTVKISSPHKDILKEIYK